MASVNLEEQFKEILDEYKKTLNREVENVLTDIGNTMIQELSNASPVGVYETLTGEPHFKDCWAMKTKYHGVRYLGNTKRVHDDIPLSNLIEFGSKGKPFIERTFEQNKDRLYSEFVKKLGGKIK